MALVCTAGGNGFPATAAGDPPPAAAEPSIEPLGRFASILDETVGRSRAAGIYARGPSLAFRLEGHGPVFVIRALRSPLGGASEYLRLMSEAMSIRNGPLRRGPRAGTQRSEDLRRIARQLAEAAGSLNDLAARGAREEGAPGGHARRLELLRLEAIVAALEARLGALSAGGHAGEVPEAGVGIPPPVRAPVELLERRLLDALLMEGRTVAARESDSVSIVLLVSRVGGGEAAATLQLSARGSDLPASREPEALRRAEGKVRVVRTGF